MTSQLASGRPVTSQLTQPPPAAGVGKSKKIAKRQASNLLLTKLRELPPPPPPCSNADGSDPNANSETADEVRSGSGRERVGCCVRMLGSGYGLCVLSAWWWLWLHVDFL